MLGWVEFNKGVIVNHISLVEAGPRYHHIKLLCADREVTFLAARKIGTDRKTQNGLQDGLEMTAGFQNIRQHLTYIWRLTVFKLVCSCAPPPSTFTQCHLHDEFSQAFPIFCHSFTSVYYCQHNPRNEKKNKTK